MVKYKSDREVMLDVFSGIRLTNMLYNHGPGSILETVQGPVVVQGWDKMISEILPPPQLVIGHAIILYRMVETLGTRLAKVVVSTTESWPNWRCEVALNSIK